MNTLFDYCKVREDFLNPRLVDEVLDITDLSTKNIDAKAFFDKNYITQGMEQLITNSFKRFHGQPDARGLIKLTQSMGGGKTHNMITLGLLAKHPEFRKQLLGNDYNDFGLGEIRVVTFTGRNTDVPYGFWGEIAEQLGKGEVLKDYYSPLRAPGENTWVNLLKGGPLLILIDELPPYLEYTKSVQIGNSDLSIVTQTAISNLFSALVKDELRNVCFVMSDLDAAYESGSEIIRSNFNNLSKESNRSALDLQPVNGSTDEVYHIMRKKIFCELPSEEEIQEVAIQYKKELEKAVKMGVTNENPEDLYTEILSSYPFHPNIRNLYMRFKENQNFQQTRGLLRLMREIVTPLFKGKELARENDLISFYNLDFSRNSTTSMLKEIKPSLESAIPHDLYAKGTSVCERIDRTNKTNRTQELGKLLFISSLSDIPDGVIGLNQSELIANLVAPNKDISGTVELLKELLSNAWYVHQDNKGSFFFKNEENIIAKINRYTNSYVEEDALRELKRYLEAKFTPHVKNSYQKLLVFPNIDEIQVQQDLVTLVIFKPEEQMQLTRDLEDFYNNIEYKNRILFVTGNNKDIFLRLLGISKRLKAIVRIKEDYQSNLKRESDPNFIRLDDLESRARLDFISLLQETFQYIKYPSRRGFRDVQFRMNFTENDANGEEQVVSLLEANRKFNPNILTDNELSMKELLQNKLFMPNPGSDKPRPTNWNTIKRNSATDSSFFIFDLKDLETFKKIMIEKEYWRENENNQIEVGPFTKQIQLNVREIGEELELIYTNTKNPVIHYEVNGQTATLNSPVLEKRRFKPENLQISFICVDGDEENETSEVLFWEGKLRLVEETKLGDEVYVTLLSTDKNADIFYTLDGTDPISDKSLLYGKDIKHVEGIQLIQAIAKKDGVTSNKIEIRPVIYTEETEVNGEIPVTEVSGPVFDRTKLLKLNSYQEFNSNSEVYLALEKMKKHEVRITKADLLIMNEMNGNDAVSVSLFEGVSVSADKVSEAIHQIKEILFNSKQTNIILSVNGLKFLTGKHFERFIEEIELPNKISQREIIQ